MALTKRALVLGCGGVAGGAWSIAAMHEVQKQLGWQLHEADIFIGTSVGAVLATLLSQGVTVEQLLACQTTENQACGWNHETDSGGAFPPLPRLRINGFNLLRLGLQGKVSGLTATMGGFPQGQADMSGFIRLVDSVVPKGQWSHHPNTWLMVVDAETGERVALGRDVKGMPMSQVVCASYAVPSWCPPVKWHGRTYLDGGIGSPVSADFLLGSGVTEAVVIAPMASRDLDNPRHPFSRIERRVRKYMTQIVANEVAALRQSGVRVLRIEPSSADLEAFGFNLMDPARRKHVLTTALLTSPQVVKSALTEF